jgi:D-3-phosphoglycerate dehydrogenase
MTAKKVLVTDYTWSSTQPESEVLAKAGAEIIESLYTSEEKLVELAADADAILTCFAQVTPAVVRAGKKLKVIGRYGIGVDNIAVDVATGLGIPVTNVPAYCLDEVAEQTLAFLLACARRVCHFDRHVRAGGWDLKTGMPMFRISGKTMGLFGFGKIGETVARKATALGMHVIFYSLFYDEKAAEACGAKFVEMDELVKRSDFLSLHAPLTPGTEKVINADVFKRMKAGAFLINTARGGLVDFDALHTALVENQIGGAAVDVFVPERFPEDHPLLQLDHFISAPHVAFYSEESVLELQVKAAENVRDILNGRKPAAIINPEVLERPEWSHLE